MPNGIDLVLADHRRVEDLFARFAETGDATLVGQIVDALSAHDDAEQSALYPLAGELLGDEAMIMGMAEAHSMVKRQIDALKTQEGVGLIAAVEELRKLVERHVQDEETSLLPKLTEAATPQQLDGLGARFSQAKQRVG